MHEPALILLGQRGARAHRERGPRARSRLLWLASLTVIAGGVALLTATTAAQASMALNIGLTGALAALVWRGAEKTAPGELLASMSFAFAGAPVLLQGGATTRLAVILSALWAAIFIMGTLAVRGVIQHKRGRPGATRPALLSVIFFSGAAAALLASGQLTMLLAAALLPTGALALALALRPPHPRNLRRLGFSLLGASCVAGMLMVIAALG